MRASDFLVIASGVLSMTVAASAATRYVNLNNPAPVAPYTSWATAATDIQAAVDAAVAGDEIVVTNGTYASGGRAVYGAMTNRVAIDKAVTVRSVNGPLVTIIEGRAAPGSSNGYGNGAFRCVYVGTNAVLSGFTLTNGHTLTCRDMYKEQSGGGAWCEVSGVITNCTVRRSSANWYGGGAYSGTLNNCMLSGNSAIFYGGGAYYGTLNNCTLSSNSANYYGGGAYSATLDHCTLNGNSASYGGGASGGTLNNCTLNNCTLSGNSANHYGGGAAYGTLNNCRLRGNFASDSGGGTYGCALTNCFLSGNLSSDSGGGVSGCTLNNCTLIGNSANRYGGGASSATLNNCIVYYNSAPYAQDYSSSTLRYCCATPLPPGPGNIDAEPLLASTTHLSAQSPCIGRGSGMFSTGVDIDGENWLNPPCIGADQYVQGQATGALSLAIDATYTNVAAGFPVSFAALNEGKISGSVWDFGDAIVVSNRACVSHAWVSPGLYTVRLTGYNDSWPGGVSTAVQVRVGSQSVHYVDAGSTTPVYPYTNWAGAAANIQDAIDASTQIGRLVLVADGIYKTGGRAVYGTMTNRVVVSEGVELRSVNGPSGAFIEGKEVPGASNGTGDGAVRCVYVGTNAVLSGFTLTNGHTQTSGDVCKERRGGGAWCEISGVLTNCTLINNHAALCGGGAFSGTCFNCAFITNSADDGGGAYSSTLNNCTFRNNKAAYGGGAYYGILINCTLCNNKACTGGGTAISTLLNCTLSGNIADNAGGAYASTLHNCVLSGNVAYGNGGGVYSCDPVWNCILTGNSSKSAGGGASDSMLYNCIVYYNIAPTSSNSYCTRFSHCCTTPLPSSGRGNIEGPPGFVDTNGWSNLRLQTNSPCINAGVNSQGSTSTDLDGSPRIVGGTVDIGAYEFQSPASIISYGWLQQYGLSTDGLADLADSDADGVNNWQEWAAGTNPTNSASALRMLAVPAASSTTNGITVGWTSVPNRTYCLERALILGAAPGFGIVRGNISGWEDSTTFIDTNATGPGPFFYRVRVEN